MLDARRREIGELLPSEGSAILKISGCNVVVDAEDIPRLSSYKWSVYVVSDWLRYAISSDGKGMHRIIMNAPAGMVVDHRNGYGLDNRKANLRICSQAENARNTRLRKSNQSSQYRGVSRIGERWAAQICCEGKNKYLGTFRSEQEAALVYDKAALIYFGEFAPPLNFTNSCTKHALVPKVTLTSTRLSLLESFGADERT